PIDVLLTPTRIYVKSILTLISKLKVNGIAHVTGGGFIENVPRMFPEGLGAEISIDSYEVPKIFRALQKKAGIPDSKAYNTFNMGIGMVLAIDEKNAAEAVKILDGCGEKAYVIGKVTRGEGVTLC
ncbi:MAG: AIR synthase-related protein, partial [Clostridia bacterium]|nr:AIR synthase-related protein [Clostridia bacterium]